MRIGGRVVSPAAGCVRICGERDGHDAVFRRGPEECGWQMCAFIELGGVIFELPAPRVCEPGRSLRNFPVAASLRVGQQPAQQRFSSDLQSRAAACGAPADEATAQLRAFAPGRLRPARLKEPQIFPAISSAGFGCCVPGPAKPRSKKQSQPAEQNITKGVTHCLAPVLADCDRNHACGNGPLRHRCSARTSFGLVMRIVGKIRENSSANAKRLLRHCVPRAITGRCAGRNRSEKRFMLPPPWFRLIAGWTEALRQRPPGGLRGWDRSSGRNRQGIKKSGAVSISYRGHWDTRNQSIVRALAAPSRTGQGLTRTDNFHT